MSTETLRRAAALMRERALAASNAPWTALTMFPTRSEVINETEIDGGVVVRTPSKDDFDVEHIASWHPGTALTVADLLDEIALRWDYVEERELALAVAHAYLQETP